MQPFDLFLNVTDQSSDYHKQIVMNIFNMGWEHPSIVQRDVIPKMLQDFSDFVFQAPSGQGKTGTFLIPLLWKVPKNFVGIFAIILLPTRELALQVLEVAEMLAKDTDVVVLNYIGKTKNKDIKLDIKRPIFIVGTLGKIQALAETHDIVPKYLVLDEADSFFNTNVNAVDEIHELFGKILGLDTHVVFSSATYSNEIKDFVESQMKHENGDGLFHKDTIIMFKDKDQITLEGIKQRYIVGNYESRQSRNYNTMYYKSLDLVAIINDFCVTKAIIFVNTKRNAEIVHNTLEKQQFESLITHGDIDQQERKRILDEFTQGRCNFLISTDLLSRGIDISNISHVFNLEIPICSETYIHRIGRSGRHGKTGVTISIVTQQELKLLEDYCREYHGDLQELSSSDI